MVRPATARDRALSRRFSADQSNGQFATGSASWSARSPEPIARTAVSGSRFQWWSTAMRPGKPWVMIQAPVSSAPSPSTRGTTVNLAAHRRRATSAARSCRCRPASTSQTAVYRPSRLGTSTRRARSSIQSVPAARRELGDDTWRLDRPLGRGGDHPLILTRAAGSRPTILGPRVSRPSDHPY